MAFKVNIHMRLPRLQIGKLPAERVRFIRRAAGMVCLVYSLWLLWVIYQTVVLSVVYPADIDPSQVSARQEKVNRKLLDTITERDTERKNPIDLGGLIDPFSR